MPWYTCSMSQASSFQNACIGFLTKLLILDSCTMCWFLQERGTWQFSFILYHQAHLLFVDRDRIWLFGNRFKPRQYFLVTECGSVTQGGGCIHCFEPLFLIDGLSTLPLAPPLQLRYILMDPWYSLLFLAMLCWTMILVNRSIIKCDPTESLQNHWMLSFQ